MCETHLKKEDTLQCKGYISFVHNRSAKHKKAPYNKGGVAILVKDSLLDIFHVKVVDMAIDGIIGIELTSKSSEFTIVLFCCYLPPENSVWGRDPTTFFSHLIAQTYLHQHSDIFLICGDLNGRIGNVDDLADSIDEICKRRVIDTIKGGHGDAIIDYAKDCKLAIVNGRITPEKDNYTSVSGRGKAVVDYMLLPHDCFSFCKDFRVDLMSELLLKFKLYPMLSDVCKVPDHSLLSMKLLYSYAGTPGLTLNDCNTNIQHGESRNN